MPTVGPCGKDDLCPCRLYAHHDRARKTGPCFPIRIMCCRTHERCFTLYPPGHVPYGRQALAPVAPDGSLRVGAQGAYRFRGTLFEAALDAAEGRAWPHRYCDASPLPRLPTQAAHLRQAAGLVGVAPGLDARQREATAELLGIPGQLLHACSVHLETHPTYARCGEAIRAVLEVLPETRMVFERLAESGHRRGLWPVLYRWHVPSSALHTAPFCLPRTRAPPGPG